MYAAEHARTGSAAVSRVAARNPMGILSHLREQSPKASAEILFLKWRDEIKDDEDMLSAALHHAFTNMLTAIDRMSKKSLRGRVITEAEREKQETDVNQIIKTVKKVVLMSLILPNGKALRYCTFAECAAAGGWFAKVAKLGKPNQIVGTVVTEEQLAKIKT